MPAKRKKAKEPTFEEIATQIDKVVKEENIDIDKIVAEAVEWARKQK
jgi:hypothetical protein